MLMSLLGKDHALLGSDLLSNITLHELALQPHQSRLDVLQ